MSYQQGKNNEIDPLIKDLYCLFVNEGSVGLLRKIQIFFHIRSSKTEVCKYLKKNPIIDKMYKESMTTFNEDMP